MGFLIAGLSAIFYALSNVLMKKGMRHSATDNGMLITLCINICLLGSLLGISRLFAPVNIGAGDKTGLYLFLAAGFLTAFLGRMMLFSGIRKIGSARAAGIKNSAPIFTVLFAIILLDETIIGVTWLGIGLIFLGLFVQGYVLFKNEGNKVDQFGFIISLGAALGFGIGQGVRKQALDYFPAPFAGAFFGALAALFSFVLIAAFKRELLQTIKSNFSLPNRYYILGGIFTSLALLSFFISISSIQVAYAGAILAIEPIVTIMLSKVLLGSEEKVTVPLLVCACLIFLGAGVISLTA